MKQLIPLDLKKKKKPIFNFYIFNLFVVFIKNLNKLAAPIFS